VHIVRISTGALRIHLHRRAFTGIVNMKYELVTVDGAEVVVVI
jgi:hypothetical protein